MKAKVDKRKKIKGLQLCTLVSTSQDTEERGRPLQAGRTAAARESDSQAPTRRHQREQEKAPAPSEGVPVTRHRPGTTAEGADGQRRLHRQNRQSS